MIKVKANALLPLYKRKMDFIPQSVLDYSLEGKEFILGKGNTTRMDMRQNQSLIQ
jgi:hypothetical protein